MEPREATGAAETGTLNGLIEASISRHWERPALCDYGAGTTPLRYADVAEQIARYHLTWQLCGYEPGFKVAICGRNSAAWAVTLLACFTYGAVPVPLLSEFSPSTVQHLVRHSGARLLVAGASIAHAVDAAEMPELDAIVACDRLHQLLYCRSERFRRVILEADRIYAEHYPTGLTPDRLCYHRHRPDDLCLLSYTSGTTSEPKGVMIPERALWSNMAFAREVLPMFNSSHRVVSILPTAHLYGLSFELLYEFCVGMEVTFLGRTPSPQVILGALAEKRPSLIVVVPLVIEKIVQRGVLPRWQKPGMRLLRSLPVVRGIVRRKVRQALVEALGGEFYEVIVGGAALSPEVEALLREVGFPFTVGYGMTECAPIIGYSDWHTFVPQSCGKAAPRLEVRIDSADPQRTEGEILVRGMNVMLGYYRNDEATRAAIDADGWLHTGDVGVIDAEGNIFIRGRLKTMLLGPSGQNIYPEELEAEVQRLLPYVAECLVVQRGGSRLVALVCPDRETARREAGVADDAALAAYLTERLPQVNRHLPSYARLAAVELVEHEFEKTPKRSIKRFLYS